MKITYLLIFLLKLHMKSLKIDDNISSEQRLFMSVVTLALEDASYTGPYLQNILYKRDAIDWIKNKGKDFQLICLMADMDSDYIYFKAKQHNLFVYTDYQSLVLQRTSKSRSRSRYVLNLSEEYL